MDLGSTCSEGAAGVLAVVEAEVMGEEGLARITGEVMKFRFYCGGKFCCLARSEGRGCSEECCRIGECRKELWLGASGGWRLAGGG